MSWWVALLVKPFIGTAILAGMYYLPRFIAWPIYKLTPDCRLKRWLFLGWDHDRAAESADAGQRRLK